MTHARWIWGLLVSAVIGCGSDAPSSPVTFNVMYSATGNIVVDSLKYADSGGQLITVASPGLPWSVDLGVQDGGAVELRAWGYSLIGGTSIRLIASWIAPGAAPFADTSLVVLSAPGQVTASLVRRTI